MQKTKNNLSDLNEYLFECLDRITNDEIDGDKLESEIKRSEAVTKIAKTIIDNGNLVLSAKRHLDEYDYDKGKKVNIDLLGVNE